MLLIVRVCACAMIYGIIVATACLTILPIDSPSSFEVLCVHVSSGTVSEILVVVYRPGSQRVQQRFFDELSSVLERAGTYTRRRCIPWVISTSA
jgi:hypothetical protein